MTTEIYFKGDSIKEFHHFIEDKINQINSPYGLLGIDEMRSYRDGKTAGFVEIIMLIMSGITTDLFKDLLKEFIENQVYKGKHSVTYIIKNDSNEELTITLNNLSLDEIHHMIEEFKGNIVDVNSRLSNI